jgi:hypothetical protein
MFLQAGVDLMQPAAPGQSIAGQIGAGIGAGLEAKDRQQIQNTEQEQKAVELGQSGQKIQSETALNKAQEEYYRSRGGYYAAGGAQANANKTRYGGVDAAVRAFNGATQAYQEAQKELADAKMNGEDTTEAQAHADEMRRLVQTQAAALQAEQDKAGMGNVSGAPAPAAEAAPVVDPAKVAQLKAAPPDQVLSQAAQQVKIRPAATAAILATLKAAGFTAEQLVTAGIIKG